MCSCNIVPYADLEASDLKSVSYSSGFEGSGGHHSPAKMAGAESWAKARTPYTID